MFVLSSSKDLPWSFPPSIAPFLSPSLAPHCSSPSLRYFLLRSLPPSPLSLAQTSLPSSHHRFLPPSPCSPSYPPSFPAPPSPCFPPSNSTYTVCVCMCVYACVWVCLASCTEYCVGHNHAWHWDNGVFVPVADVVSVARCYLQQTCSHVESVFAEE